MFNTPTALVLGAGASVPYGLPTGDALKRSILNGVKSILDEDVSIAFATSLDGWTLIKDGYRGFWRHLKTDRARKFLTPEFVASAHRLRDFSTALSEAESETIDRFLRENQSFAPIGRCFIVLELIRCMIEMNDEVGVTIKNFAQPGERRWISRLINKMHEPSGEAFRLEDNKLTIVNFNYDPIVSLVLSKRLAAPERFRDADWQSSFSLFHVHGQIGVLDRDFNNLGNAILEIASKISLIGVTAPDPTKENNLEAVRSSVREAEQVFAVGFAFDDYNTDLLALSQHPNPDAIFCLNYDGDLGVAQRISRLGVPSRNVMSGTADNKLELSEAIRRGFLEQTSGRTPSYLLNKPLLVL